MHPETLLAIVAAFAGFLLKTSLGFCICWAMSKVLVSPGRKFLLWLGFLMGSACYWLWLAEGFLPHGVLHAPSQMSLALVLAAPLGKWEIQPSWAFPLSIVLRTLGVLYLLVLGSFLFTRIKKQVHLRWILRFSYRAPEGVETLFQPIAESLDARNAQLLVLSGIHSPATFGWIRPTVLLPPVCLEQAPGDLEDIFRHELQHVRRRDFVFKTIASLCRALLFFHPAVWYAMRGLELESELACDLAAVGDSPGRRAAYAECLVRFARLNAAEAAKPWNLDFAGSSVQLKVRIRSILSETRKIPGWLLGVRATLGLLLLAGFLGIAPSLFVVLSYEQHGIMPPAGSALLATRTDVRLQRRTTHTIRSHRHAMQTGRVFPAPVPIVPTAATVDAAVDAAPSLRRTSGQISSNESLPVLKRRSDVGEVAAPESASPIDIPLSSQPSHSIITKGRAAASAILAGASEAIDIASRGHDKEDH